MQEKVDLKVDWATHEAAKYACLNWHYSKSVPVPPLVKIGAWENNCFIGVIIFSRGANNNLLKAFDIDITEGCELVRIALSKHKSFVSEIMSKSILFLKKENARVRLLVSFADPSEGHHGGIYQATNWIYTGKQQDSIEYISPSGKRVHGRMVKKKGWTVCMGKVRKTLTPEQCVPVVKPGKHRYLMPLDKKMRKQILPLAQPYPKRSKQAMDATSVTEMGQHQSDRSTEASHA